MNTRSWSIIALSEFVVIAGMLAFVVPTGASLSLLTGQPAGRPAEIHAIHIHYDYVRTQVFPQKWLEAPIDCGGEQVDLAEAQRAVPLIEKFAAAYNPDVLRKNLTDIYLLSDLHCFDREFGGTNSTSSVYLRVGTRADGYTDRVLLATLHEEFSSILFRQYDFPTGVWQELSGGEYAYPNNSVEILGEAGLKEVASEDLLRRGFLTRYAASSLENDYNEYAGWMFVWPDLLCNYGSHYPTIQAKASMVNAFYRSIQPQMETWDCQWDPHPKW